MTSVGFLVVAGTRGQLRFLLGRHGTGHRLHMPRLWLRDEGGQWVISMVIGGYLWMSFGLPLAMHLDEGLQGNFTVVSRHKVVQG